MNRILIACLERNGKLVRDRGRLLQYTLQKSSPFLEVTCADVRDGDVFELLSYNADAIVCVGFSAKDIIARSVLAKPIVWDLFELTADDVHHANAGQDSRRQFTSALAAAHSYVDIGAEAALAIEDVFTVGISSHDISAAIAAAAKPFAVAIGTGLGNMINATPMVRWLSECLHAPVDLVIHDRFDEGVALFARSPWINAVFPGYEFTACREYKVFISTVTAGAMRPPAKVERLLNIDLMHSYNEEGRFIQEIRLNLLGLGEIFHCDTFLLAELPLPFIRDIDYAYKGEKIIGIANGKKAAHWAKREWRHMEELTSRLIASGWEVRSFGLPLEYVEGAENFTGIPMRDMLFEISKCSFFISHDGGIAHMADGIGVPAVWLFGPTSLVKNGPVSAPHRVLQSGRECGPCLYKHDWVRCDQPLCMDDIQIEEVITALNSLEATISCDGYRKSLSTPSPGLVAYEIEALHRPSPEYLWNEYLSARLGPLPRSTRHLDLLTLRLLANGDLLGVASLSKVQAAAGLDGAINRFVRSAIAEFYLGPTPLDGLTTKDARPVRKGDIEDLIDAMSAFSSNLRRVMLNFALKYFIYRGNRVLTAFFLRTATASGLFSREIVRQIHRAAERVTGSESSSDITAAAKFEENPSYRRMRSVKLASIEARFSAAAEGLAAPFGLEAETVVAHGFAPYCGGLRGFEAESVRIELPNRTISVPHLSVVLVLVPHVALKNALPGSTSALITLHSRRLAMLGLRPVVASVGFDDVADGWTLRDSVTYVQAHRSWVVSQWEDVFRVYPAAAIISYGGIERELDLPEEMSSRIVSILLPGLHDLEGMHVELSPAERWAALPVRDFAYKMNGAICGNFLTNALFVPPKKKVLSTAYPVSVVVIVPNVQDFAALISLITIVPSCTFTVFTGVLHRGIEKNICIRPLNEFKIDELGEAQVFLQFSTRAMTLSAESVVWIESGRRCIAIPLDLDSGVLFENLRTVTAPFGTLDWAESLRAEAADIHRVAGGHMGSYAARPAAAILDVP